MEEAAEYKAVLEVASRAARAAAEVHERHLGQVKADDWSSKGISDFVSFVDHEAEAEILSHVRQAFPTHHILAEESHSAENAEGAESAEWVWIVDPLDGTTNFLHRFPMYCASIGVLHRGAPVVAAVACSATQQEWTAYAGGGAYCNGERIHVSEIPFRRALIGTGFPFKLPQILPTYLRQFEHIIRDVSDIRRGGSAALDLCYLANGFLDGFWELDLRPWDYAAGVLMIREAGGIVTGLDGSDPEWAADGGGIIAGNPSVYHDIVRKLSEVGA